MKNEKTKEDYLKEWKEIQQSGIKVVKVDKTFFSRQWIAGRIRTLLKTFAPPIEKMERGNLVLNSEGKVVFEKDEKGNFSLLRYE